MTSPRPNPAHVAAVVARRRAAATPLPADPPPDPREMPRIAALATVVHARQQLDDTVGEAVAKLHGLRHNRLAKRLRAAMDRYDALAGHVDIAEVDGLLPGAAEAAESRWMTADEVRRVCRG